MVHRIEKRRERRDDHEAWCEALGQTPSPNARRRGHGLPPRPKLRDIRITEAAVLLIEALRPVAAAKEPIRPALREGVEDALLAALRPAERDGALSELEVLRLDLLAHAVLLEAVSDERYAEPAAAVRLARAGRPAAVAQRIVALVGSGSAPCNCPETFEVIHTDSTLVGW
ncbi:MAG: hypothetical protein AAF416_16205 [Pseudomonadota bacterium]